ncbi:hypothetical protein ACWDR2_35635 [Streptomyces sp. NPDC003631]|uniref:Serine protease n=1 Tax=Streptomyces lannensis TaxID=766498 RepID=A0ABP7KB03_9ACTN|nr:MULTISPECIES: hypothetical protein [unclassified Streptomyces]MEE1670155.1 hypothetical protein [Streptomyces sp. WAC07094]TFV31639.1 hypothetical protein E4K10_06220 [Streptomyces sp. T1317-0309]KUJ54237.1 hypothetical protein ADL25_07215 [Streptomyces sp. NRRL F-5122]MBW8705140.1 hypothetical protein [Streptomyces sp. MBT84]MDX3261936.1 hypothetical protein [Streptomyces sp. MI02-2A]
MAIPHEIDPRATGDPRNVYTSDEQFYRSDRPEQPVLPEDRPRGGRPADPVRHRSTWATVALVAGIILLVLVGIALFP